jgi:hypothetical protein
MAEKTTAAPWAIPYPTNLGEIKLGAQNMEEIAERVTTICKERFLSISKHAGAYEAKSGELGVQETAAATTTLPAAATKDQIIGVWCKASSCKVTTSGGAFVYGGSITLASKTATVTLDEGQWLVVQSDGTNWLIVNQPPQAGQYFATTGALGAEGVVGGSEHTVITSANTKVSYSAWIHVSSGATTEIGYTVRIVKNGGNVLERAVELAPEQAGPWGGGQVVAEYLQTTAGSNTWKIEIVGYGTANVVSLNGGMLSFTA